MSIPRNLASIADNIDVSGVLQPTGGGTVGAGGKGAVLLFWTEGY